ncbi:MAG: hypothetical protein COS99_06150 [Candidatus Omnitrophica bacterium CG07_land_8_20_14_0_80_42_15]|uniref:DNA recombination protein RmuC n=1 Tax=Candidatus Aquitaenariimonas noxiae TaxID=1974741 RepID=A0A2J0KVB7_9BACT|nr:MAG: hypothetical protein COS99_06150 [Candidatus Omnitrophica bacterium CG07_land_8_20_14_0_80_42_15]
MINLPVILTIVAFIVIALFLAILIQMGKYFKEAQEAKTKDQSLVLIQQQVDNMRSQLETSIDRLSSRVTTELSQITGQVGKRLDNAAVTIGNVQRQLGELAQTSLRMMEIGKDISSLQEILRPPKMRGGMGETLLRNLLEQIMPEKDYYSFEHSFKSGERVDAVIKIGGRMVPVDAKFPLESFRRLMNSKTDSEKNQNKKEFEKDVMRHIDVIANKYILPDEGTYEFALMYIPAENVYYETIIKYEFAEEREGIFEHALSRKVIPVSPNSFYAYLQVIILGLKGLAIEKSTKEVIAALERLQGDFSKFYEDFRKVGSHISDARSSFEKSEKKLLRLGDKLTQLDNPAKKIEVYEE